MFSQVLAVALGGAIGASARLLNSKLFEHFFGSPQIWATYFVNVLGCFLMGITYTYVQHHHHKSFLMIGLLGSLTTWSTFSMETIIMFNNGDILKPIVYFILTSATCLLAFYLGMKL